MVSPSDIRKGLRNAVPRLVAEGVTDEERPKSRAEKFERHRSNGAALGDSAPIVRHFSEYLDIVFAYPIGDQMYKWASVKDLVDAGISEAEFEEAAFGNLESIVKKEGFIRWVGSDVALCQHQFASSFLLADSFWIRKGLKPQDMTVIAPTRDALIFTGTRNRAVLAELEDTRKQTWASENLVDSHRLCEHYLVHDIAEPYRWRVSATPKQVN